MAKYVPPGKQKLSTKEQTASNQQLLINMCGFTEITENDSLMFNLPIEDLERRILLDNYASCMDFCVSKIRDFTLNSPITMSYQVDGLTDLEKGYFNVVTEQYTGFSNNIMRLLRTAKTLPTDVDIYKINEDNIDETMKDKKYNIQTEEEIYDSLRERVKQLDVCAKSSQSSNGSRQIKNPEELQYYREEFARETEILQEVETSRAIIKPDSRFFYGLSQDDKKKTAIGFMSDRIQWGTKNYFAFDKKTIDATITELSDKIRENPNLVKMLMTFLPLNLFAEDNGQYSLNQTEFRSFLEIKGHRERMNIQQYRLGL